MKPNWLVEKEKAEAKRALEKKFHFLGKKVRRRVRSKWKEGVVVLDRFNGDELEQFIRYSIDDLEQLDGLPFQVWDENSQTFVESSKSENS